MSWWREGIIYQIKYIHMSWKNMMIIIIVAPPISKITIFYSLSSLPLLLKPSSPRQTSKPPLPQPKPHPFRPDTLQRPHRLARRRRLARLQHRTPIAPLQRFVEIQEFDRGVLGHQFIFLGRSRGAESRDPIAVVDGLHRLRVRGAEVRGDGWEEGRP